MAFVVTLTMGTLLIVPGSLLEQLTRIVSGVCDQKHPLLFGRVTLPLCQRDTGIYTSALCTVLTLLALGRGHAAVSPPRAITRVLLVGALGMVGDGVNSWLFDYGPTYLYTPQPLLRILSGIAMGIALATYLLFALNALLRQHPDRDLRVLYLWRELGVVGLVNILVFAVLHLRLPGLAYPVALFSTLGLLVMSLGMNLLLVGVLGRFTHTFIRWGQLARPGTLALALTAIEFWLFVGLRHPQ
ncbi:MAG TPA: DUF2085 domain-containing protein [Herpetosiphonaceae bacterium]